MSVEVFEVKIDVINSNGLGETLRSHLKDETKGLLSIAKINSEFLMRALKNEEFKKCINSFELCLADGVGVLWAAKYLSLPLVNITGLRQAQVVWQMVYSGASLVFYPGYCREPIPHAFRGTDMMYDMVELAEKNRTSIYLLGAPKETLEQVVVNLEARYPELDIVGHHDGYDFENEEIIDEINVSGAKMLFVALGSPTQEYWIRDNMKKLKFVRVAVGEGGTFNFIGGSYRRAPKIFKTLGVEWLWRLFANKNTTTTEKSRLIRVWNAVPVFIYKVVQSKIGNK